MELLEAKQRLTYINHAYDYGDIYLRDDLEAIDTVLKALDNSVSKEYHEMVVKEQNDIIDDLKSKLDNSISKDEVRKIINNKCYVEVSDYLDVINGIEELLGE